MLYICAPMTNTISGAILIGVVEGITEFLPVSSTGHLLLVEKLLHQRYSDLFNIVIQSGAVLAVLPLFRERLAQFIFRWREAETLRYAAQIALAFLVTGVGGVCLEKAGFELPETALPIATALAVGGAGFIAVEAWFRKGRPTANAITWKVAVLIGLAQLVAAVFPGTSRSGATILLALAFGITRPAATEFSFLVGIPTMLAAGGLKIFSAWRHAGPNGFPEDLQLLGVAFVVSAVVSFAVVKWLLSYVRTHTFTAFGWYRIALALLLFGLLATGRLE